MDLKEIIILICWKIHDTIEIGDFMKLELLTYEKENLPRGWKPYYIYLIMVDHIEVGRIVLREGSNEERYYDGHIGYTIEKEYRGHHYSKDACLLLFDKAKEKGFKQLMITCSVLLYPSLYCQRLCSRALL